MSVRLVARCLAILTPLVFLGCGGAAKRDLALSRFMRTLAGQKTVGWWLRQGWT